jgi:hypothetical protein
MDAEKLWITDGGRMRWVLSHVGLTQTELAQELGFPPHYIGDLARDKKRFPRELAERIQQEFGVDLLWLLTGKGTPWGDTSTTTEGPVHRARVIVAPARYFCGSCGMEVDAPDQYACGGCGALLEWHSDEEATGV